MNGKTNWVISKTMDYFVLKKELWNHETTWKNFKSVLPSDRSWSAKTIYYIIPTTWYSGEGKAMETINSGGKGLERGDK